MRWNRVGPLDASNAASEGPQVYSECKEFAVWEYGECSASGMADVQGKLAVDIKTAHVLLAASSACFGVLVLSLGRHGQGWCARPGAYTFRRLQTPLPSTHPSPNSAALMYQEPRAIINKASIRGRLFARRLVGVLPIRL